MIRDLAVILILILVLNLGTLFLLLSLRSNKSKCPPHKWGKVIIRNKAGGEKTVMFCIECKSQPEKPSTE